MRSVELAGAIGLMFGKSQIECLNGDFMGSIAESIGLYGGRNRWRPDGVIKEFQ